MTVFYCAKCGAQLTPDLQKLPDVPDAPVCDRDRDRRTWLAPSTVPRGHYAIDPEPWGAPFVAPDPQHPKPSGNRALLMPSDLTDTVSAGPRNSVVVHPDDVSTVQSTGASSVHWGCCGPLGTGGRNMACACGTLLATLVADCIGPHELHLDPVRVYAYTPDPPT
ncbi:hypothetical protein SAMN05421870_112180 [Streptomyces qinglanensis]|uniref:Uncharacterized protein n=1 Tax=Streptomyces qinglanensis TaxID=943816 RepID=A0A1H9VM56_9ACTN|nr:hypothetical protein SAMN05421870_112180 [Streptomyces qinglanensis]